MTNTPQHRYIISSADSHLLSTVIAGIRGDPSVVLEGTVGPPQAPHTAVVRMDDEQAQQLRRKYPQASSLSIERDQPLSPYGGKKPSQAGTPAEAAPGAREDVPPNLERESEKTPTLHRTMTMPKQNTPSSTPDNSEEGRADGARRPGEPGDAGSAADRSAGRRIGRRKTQYLVASRQPEGLMTMGLAPLQANVIEQALRSSPDIEIVDIIKPKTNIGAFGTGVGGDASTVLVARMPDEKASVLHQQGQGRLIVEQDQNLHLLDPSFSPGLVSGFIPNAGSAVQVPVDVIGANNTPVAGAEVYLFGSLLPASATTNEQGRAVLTLYGETPDSITALYVKAKSDYWSFYQRNPDLDFQGPNVVGLRSLAEWPSLQMFPQQQTLGWGQRAMRLDQLPPQFRGQGVKIAIIDSGAAAGTHEDLKALHLGVDIINKKTTPDSWTQDVISHGSHCAGVIAGADGPHGIRGFAPDAEVHVCKLFPGGQVSQLIDALEYCIEKQVDVVNLSLGGAQPSEALEQQLLRAKRQGIACIVAAGNSGDDVQYPASSPHALAVAAIGKLGEFPPDSYHAETVGSTIDANGYFSAKFSCHGPRVAVCAPGVAIASSVPDNNFAVWDGTSMAAPHVTGLAALVLAHHPDFRQRYVARSAERVERLFQLIRYSARPVNIGDPGRTGFGMPDVLIALGLQPPVQNQLPANLQGNPNAIGGLGRSIGGLGGALGGTIGGLVGGIAGTQSPHMETLNLSPMSMQFSGEGYHAPSFHPLSGLGGLGALGGLGGYGLYDSSFANALYAAQGQAPWMMGPGGGRPGW